MENFAKKKALRRYLELKKQERLLIEQLLEIRTMATSPRAMSDGMPRAGRKTDLAGYAARWDAVLSRLEEKKAATVAAYGRIWDCIQDVEAAEEREVLSRRYLLGHDWEHIARVMGYSVRHVLRIHGAALRHVLPPDDLFDC